MTTTRMFARGECEHGGVDTKSDVLEHVDLALAAVDVHLAVLASAFNADVPGFVAHARHWQQSCCVLNRLSANEWPLGHLPAGRVPSRIEPA